MRSSESDRTMTFPLVWDCVLRQKKKKKKIKSEKSWRVVPPPAGGLLEHPMTLKSHKANLHQFTGTESYRDCTKQDFPSHSEYLRVDLWTAKTSFPNAAQCWYSKTWLGLLELARDLRFVRTCPLVKPLLSFTLASSLFQKINTWCKSWHVQSDWRDKFLCVDVLLLFFPQAVQSWKAKAGSDPRLNIPEVPQNVRLSRSQCLWHRRCFAEHCGCWKPDRLCCFLIRGIRQAKTKTMAQYVYVLVSVLSRHLRWWCFLYIYI